MGSFCLDGNAIWCKKWATNILKSNQQSFQKVLRPIHAYILDDFIVYSDMESHLMKLTLCFLKCKEYRISLNLEKMRFYDIFRINFKVHSFQGRKITRPKKGSGNS
jgi:hypothetical protein